jgi:hypothetical protein
MTRAQIAQAAPLLTVIATSSSGTNSIDGGLVVQAPKATSREFWPNQKLATTTAMMRKNVITSQSSNGLRGVSVSAAIPVSLLEGLGEYCSDWNAMCF